MRGTDIGVIDVAINDKSYPPFRVLSPAHGVRQTAQGEQIGLL
ncbi:MAG: hypothetical protein P8Y91_00340 [Desulfuromonadales bacterium]